MNVNARLIMTLTLLERLITLNGMKASEELTEEQSRQVIMALPAQELR
jgi:hypothetical protein